MVDFSFKECDDGSLTFGIKTERLLGREIRESDADFVFQVQGDAEMMKFVGDGEERKRERTDRYCNSLVKLWQKGDPISAYMFFINNNGQEGDFVGMVGFEPVKEKEGVVERTTYVAKSYQRQGYADEIYKNLFEAIMDDRSKEKSFFVSGGKQIEEIYATAHPENIASIKMQERCGFKKVGEGEKIINGISYPRDFFSLNLTQYFEKKESSEDAKLTPDESCSAINQAIPIIPEVNKKNLEQKSFVERMRRDPTKGKSAAGYNEL